MLLSIDRFKLSSSISSSSSPRFDKQKADQDEIYHWVGSPKEPLIVGIKTPVSSLLSITLYVEKPLVVPWLQLYMDPEAITHDGHVHDYFIDHNSVFLHVAYSAKLESKNEPELTQVLNIENILLCVKNKQAKRSIIDEEVHEICATLKRNNRSEPISLGRAQMIQTVLPNHVRTYSWLSKQQVVSPRDKTKEKESMLPLSFVSPRVTFSIVDHDGFSNTERILPIVLNEQDTPVVTIQFFNMKDKPPRFLEWSIRWASLLDNTTPPPSPFVRRLSALKSKRKSVANRKRYVLREELTPWINTMVTYYFEDFDKKSICIEEIYLEAKEYHKSLQAMNDYVIPRTV